MKGFVYNMTNNNNSALYTGIIRDLTERVIQHKVKKHPGSYSARYNICKLVYYESFGTVGEAIKREKQIDLINSLNPEWDDLRLCLDGI